MSDGNRKGKSTRRWHTANLRRLVATRLKNVAPFELLKTKPFETIEEVRDYLSDDIVVCLLCGAEKKTLGMHLNAVHRMTSDEYRQQFGIPWTYPLQGEATRALFREHGKRNVRKNPQLLANPTRGKSVKHRDFVPATKRQQRAVLISYNDKLRSGNEVHYKKGCAKLGEITVRQIRLDRGTGLSFSQLANRYQISKTAARRACTHKSWPSVT